MDFTTHPFYPEENSVMYVLPPAKDRYDIFIKPFKYQVRFMLCVCIFSQGNYMLEFQRIWLIATTWAQKGDSYNNISFQNQIKTSQTNLLTAWQLWVINNQKLSLTEKCSGESNCLNATLRVTFLHDERNKTKYLSTNVTVFPFRFILYQVTTVLGFIPLQPPSTQ